MDLSTADKEAFEKAILAHRGSADHPYEVRQSHLTLFIVS